MDEIKSQTSTKKPIGRYLALGFAVMSYLASLNTRKDGNTGQADDYFISAIVTAVGIALYTLGKRRKEGKGFNGSIIIEGIIFVAIVYVFGMGYLNTGWSNNPLVWFVVPFWVLIAYLILVFWKTKR